MKSNSVNVGEPITDLCLWMCSNYNCQGKYKSVDALPRALLSISLKVLFRRMLALMV